MKRFEGIDYWYRPRSYWDFQSPLLEILKNVQGTVRRKIIEQHWAAGTVEELLDDLLVDELDDRQRESLSRLHPSFMGGEYLPAYEGNELEIARIELEVSTSDVVSVRARRSRDMIFYSICDEYASDFDLSPTFSHCSLTLAELIGLIDYAGQDQSLGLDFTLAQFPLEKFSEHFYLVEEFCTVTSLFYPELSRHYRQLTDWWYTESH